jgi:GTP cyclohydrolase I
MVVVEAKHLCMAMRGVEKQNAITTTSAYSGVFESTNTRMEFMTAARGSKASINHQTSKER